MVNKLCLELKVVCLEVVIPAGSAHTVLLLLPLNVILSISISRQICSPTHPGKTAFTAQPPWASILCAYSLVTAATCSCSMNVKFHIKVLASSFNYKMLNHWVQTPDSYLILQYLHLVVPVGTVPRRPIW